MAKIKQAVFDAGPFIHLEEIQKLCLVSLFKKILTTREILEECSKIKTAINKLKNMVSKELKPKNKDMAKYLIERYSLDLGEATGIALCKQEHIKLFFTDDLEARQTSYLLGFKAHGTIGIILRAFREKLLTKKQTKETIQNLYHNSTLFFTQDLKEWTLKEISNYKS